MVPAPLRPEAPNMEHLQFYRESVNARSLDSFTRHTFAEHCGGFFVSVVIFNLALLQWIKGMSDHIDRHHFSTIPNLIQLRIYNNLVPKQIHLRWQICELHRRDRSTFLTVLQTRPWTRALLNIPNIHNHTQLPELLLQLNQLITRRLILSYVTITYWILGSKFKNNRTPSRHVSRRWHAPSTVADWCISHLLLHQIGTLTVLSGSKSAGIDICNFSGSLFKDSWYFQNEL